MSTVGFAAWQDCSHGNEITLIMSAKWRDKDPANCGLRLLLWWRVTRLLAESLLLLVTTYRLLCNTTEESVICFCRHKKRGTDADGEQLRWDIMYTLIYNIVQNIYTSCYHFYTCVFSRYWTAYTQEIIVLLVKVSHRRKQ